MYYYTWASRASRENQSIFLIHYEALMPDHTIKIAYTILQVHEIKKAIFVRRMNDESPLDFGDYGKILAKGFGAPTYNLIEYIQQKYDITFPFAES